MEHQTNARDKDNEEKALPQPRVIEAWISLDPFGPPDETVSPEPVQMAPGSSQVPQQDPKPRKR